jgi:hypothetical protein
MSPQDAAETVALSMIGIVKKDLNKGEFHDGIKNATKFIDSIEGLKDEGAWRVYAPCLLLLYAARARFQLELDLLGKGAGGSGSAQRDEAKARDTANAEGSGLTSDQRKRVLGLLPQTLSPEKSKRDEAIHELASVVEAASKTSGPPKGAKAGGGGTAAGKILPSLGVRLLCFLIGAAIWGIPVLIVVLSGASTAGGVVGMILFFVAFFIAMRGWDWFSQYRAGTWGELIKGLALLGIVFTVGGLVFVFFWTGRAVLRKLVRR